MIKIKTALISVWDKTGIVDFAKFLRENNIKILSTGGTKEILDKNNISVTSINEITKQDEIMDGRVKTLHPEIFGGILADRVNDNHLNDLSSSNVWFAQEGFLHDFQALAAGRGQRGGHSKYS